MLDFWKTMRWLDVTYSYWKRRRNTRLFTYDELTHELSLRCNVKIIQRTLTKQEFHRRIACSKSWLSADIKTKRLKFALNYQVWDWSDWYWIIWTDESAVHKSSWRSWITRRDNEKFQIDCLRFAFVRRLETMMIWVCIVIENKDSLFIWNSFWDTINSISYKAHTLLILKNFVNECRSESDNIIDLTKTNYTIMQDNVSTHKASITQDWFRKNFISLMKWSSNSTNLNLIEDVWAILKHRISQRRSRFYRRAELMTAMKEKWDRLMSFDFEKLIDSMSRRIQIRLAVG